MDNSIKEYDYRPNFKFYETGNEKDKKLYVGFELEIESEEYEPEDLTDEISKIINDEEQFVYYKHDGSLNNGLEIVSMPFTLDYIRKNSDKLKEMLKYLQDNGCRSHDTTTCGLHFHINKEYFGENSEQIENNIDKLILFTEYYKEKMIKFSRRYDFGYCRFLGEERYMNEEERLNLMRIKKEKFNVGRYMVVNIQNSNTVEFRLIRGTLNYDTFMASLEFVFNLARVIRNKEIKDISWNDVVKFKDNEFCTKYCEQREIEFDDAKMKDYSIEYLKKQNKLKAEMKRIEKEMLVMIYEALIKNTKEIPQNYMKLLENIPQKYSGRINPEILLNKYKETNFLVLANQYFIDVLMSYGIDTMTFLGTLKHCIESIKNNDEMKRKLKKVDSEFLDKLIAKHKKYKEIKREIEI